MEEKMNNCKACGSLISKKAKNCPHCGESNKTRIFKKWWFWAIAVIVVFFVFTNGGDDSVTDTNVSDPAPTTVTGNEKTTNSQKNNETGSTVADKYKWISENAVSAFNIQEKSYAFMNEHNEYFPGNESNKGAISDFVDYEITYVHLSKNITKYGDKLIEVSGDVIDIEESDDGSITYVHICDYDGKSYILYYLGSLDNVFEGTYIWGYALPLDLITFENMSNTYTEAMVCAACYVHDPESDDVY